MELFDKNFCGIRCDRVNILAQKKLYNGQLCSKKTPQSLQSVRAAGVLRQKVSLCRTSASIKEYVLT